jgi:alpha/beta superfamily hydrolase
VARRIETHLIEGPAGRLECLLEEPEDREPAIGVVVCHPHPLYGGTMHNKVVYRIARGLRRAGAVVLRFNFRGVGRSEGEHAHLEGEIEDARAALGWLRERYPAMPFTLAGFSFGARVVTRLGCAAEGAKWILAAGFPTRMGDVSYFQRCATPKVFIQSTHDEFGPRPALETMFETFAEPKRLVFVEAGDHFFAGALDAFEEAVHTEAAALIASPAQAGSA